MGADTYWKVGRTDWRLHSHKTPLARRVARWEGCFIAAWYYRHGLLEAIDIALPSKWLRKACLKLGIEPPRKDPAKQEWARRTNEGFSVEEKRNRLKNALEIHAAKVRAVPAHKSPSTGLRTIGNEGHD